MVYKIGAGGRHGHINTGGYGQVSSFLFIFGYAVLFYQLNYIAPIGYGHAGKAHFLPHKVLKYTGGGVYRHAIYLTAINHQGFYSGIKGGLKGRTKELVQVLIGHVHGRTVPAGARIGVADKVFGAGRHLVRLGKGRILQGAHKRFAHTGSYQRVFAEGFPQTRPVSVYAQIQHRGKHPVVAQPSRLLYCQARHIGCELGVEGSSQVNVLRKNSSSANVAGPMYMIDAVDNGCAQPRIFHRNLLQATAELIPSSGWGGVAVQKRPYVVGTN